MVNIKYYCKEVRYTWYSLYVKTKGVENVCPLSDITNFYSHIFSYIPTDFIITRYTVQWGRSYFATFMCNINYKVIHYANHPFFYYSHFTVIISFDNRGTGYITLLCITIT